MQHIIKENQNALLTDFEHKQVVAKKFVVHENAQLTYVFLVTDSADITITVELMGANACARIFGICLLSGEQKVVITTKQKHVAPRAESQVLVKSIMHDAAQLKYNGAIVIGKDAHKSVAQQHNKNILLSRQAHVWAQPSLEVLTNDVQCAHGSASGQVSQDQLLYLQSRGLSQNMAKKLLLQGFFADILNNMSNNKIRDMVEEKIKPFVLRQSAVVLTKAGSLSKPVLRLLEGDTNVRTLRQAQGERGLVL